MTHEMSYKARHMLRTTMDWCGTLPAMEAVKVRPSDWHKIEQTINDMASELDRLSAPAPTSEEIEEIKRDVVLFNSPDRTKQEKPAWLCNLQRSIFPPSSAP
jgi:hypothetical protein